MQEQPRVGDAPDPNGNPVVEEKKAERKKVERVTFKQQLLLKPNGIEALYKKAKQLKFSKDDEVKNLGKIVDLMKSWHFDLMPKYNFEFFVERCQSFGSKKLVQSYMAKVRKIHKGQASWEDQNAPEMDNQPQPANRSVMDAGEFAFPQRKPTSVFGDARSVSGRSENLFNGLQRAAVAAPAPAVKKAGVPNLDSDQSEDDELQQMMQQMKTGGNQPANTHKTEQHSPPQQSRVYGAADEDYEDEELPPGFDSADYE